MKKTSHLLLLSATLFLSTFFVGCKPQEEPIALEDIKIESTKKVVKKTPSVEKPVQIKQQQSSENQFEFTDTIESLTNVVLKGYAFLSTGFPVTNRLFIDIVSTKESKICKIQSEIDGSFTISNLIPGNAVLQFSLPGCDSLKTNIYLALPEAELKITFQENPMSKINGIVLLEQNNKPVEGITVKAGIYNHKKPYSTCVTDKDGKFSLVLRERFAGVFDRIVVDEPGFGKVRKYVHYGTTFVKIILRQSGEVIGKVMTEDKKPVPGIKISLWFMNFTGTSIGMDDSTSYTTVSDSKGNYKFPSVIAPAKYGFENRYESGFTLPKYYDDNGFTIEVEPDKTAVCNLIVQENTFFIAFKAKDDNGNPFLKYELKCNVNSEHLSSTLEHNINLLDDDWYYAKTLHGSEGLLSCVASENETGLNLITNNIPFSGKGTNYITLIFSDSEPNITGYILKPDGSPAKNCTIYVKCKKNHTEITADETGYFEARGLNAKKGELIKINASTRVDNSNISTNLPSGSKDVVLTLLQPCKITGRVFLNNLKTPAKSFLINIGNRYIGRNTKDGYFDICVYDFSLKKKKTGTITISVTGYSSEKFEYDFSNKSICDLGDIILKTDKSAKIEGRVVNQFKKSINVNVTLTYKNSEKKLNTFSKGINGNYSFRKLLPGNATVTARSTLGFSDTQDIVIKENDDLKLPDLVLKYIDSAVVTLTFKLPDGTLPKNIRILNKGYSIRQHGELIRTMLAGNYSDWKIKYNGKVYLADEFEITEDTDKLEVKLRESIATK